MNRSEVNPALIKRLLARAEFGDAKYPEPLTSWNGRNPLEDAEEELLDQWVYLQQAKLEREEVAMLLFEVSTKLADALFRLGTVTDDDWEYIGKCHSYSLALRKDTPRIGRTEPEEEQATRLQQALDEMSAKE